MTPIGAIGLNPPILQKLDEIIEKQRMAYAGKSDHDMLIETHVLLQGHIKDHEEAKQMLKELHDKLYKNGLSQLVVNNARHIKIGNRILMVYGAIIFIMMFKVFNYEELFQLISGMVK